jgi:spermidine synthase
MPDTRDGVSGARQRWEAIVLYVVVFMCGAVLMSVEMAGSRVLNPFFGSAIFVWGSLIGVVMAALAAGYYIGGVASDRMPSFGVLCGVIGAAGFFVAIMPGFTVPLCSAIDRAFPGPRAAPLIASVLLFLVPGILLGMVSPFAVKLSARDLGSLGNVAGKLYALSTAGSIVGTLLTAFVLIPLIGTMKLVFALGITLILIAAIGFAVIWRLQKTTPVIAAALVLACGVTCLAGYPEGPGAEITQWYDYERPHRLVYWTDSAYHLILVTEQDKYRETGSDVARPRRVLRFNDRTQSAIYIDESVYDRPTDTLKKFESAVGYTDLLHLGLIFCPDARRALFVGGGGGIGPTEFARDYGMRCEVIEIDPEVERIAREYFHIDDRIEYHIGDGRRVLNRLEGGYDLIVLDAYSSGGHIPAHLTTREYLELCRQKLAPGGVLVSNVISALKDKGSEFYQSEYRTMRAAGFPTIYTFPRYPTPEEEKERRVSREDYWRGRSINIIIVATQSEKQMTKAHVEAAARALTRRAEHPVVIKNFVHSAGGLWEGSQTTAMMLEQFDKAIELTDDYCPVDTMFQE